MAFGVAEEVPVHVFEIGFFLFCGEVGVPDGDVESAADFLHHGEGELAAFASFLNLLVVELLGGGLDEEVVGECPIFHEGVEGLGAVFAGIFHGREVRCFGFKLQGRDCVLGKLNLRG